MGGKVQESRTAGLVCVTSRRPLIFPHGLWPCFRVVRCLLFRDFALSTVCGPLHETEEVFYDNEQCFNNILPWERPDKRNGKKS